MRSCLLTLLLLGLILLTAEDCALFSSLLEELLMLLFVFLRDDVGIAAGALRCTDFSLVDVRGLRLCLSLASRLASLRLQT